MLELSKGFANSSASKLSKRILKTNGGVYLIFYARFVITSLGFCSDSSLYWKRWKSALVCSSYRDLRIDRARREIVLYVSGQIVEEIPFTFICLKRSN